MLLVIVTQIFTALVSVRHSHRLLVNVILFGIACGCGTGRRAAAIELIRFIFPNEIQIQVSIGKLMLVKAKEQDSISHVSTQPGLSN